MWKTIQIRAGGPYGLVSERVKFLVITENFDLKEKNRSGGAPHVRGSDERREAGF